MLWPGMSYNYWRDASATKILAYNRCSAWSQMASTPVSARSLMDSHGDAGKRLWITETGAPTCVPGATYTCVSPAQQADLAADEVQQWKSFPWAGGFYWYDIRDDHAAPSPTRSPTSVQYRGRTLLNQPTTPSGSLAGDVNVKVRLAMLAQLSLP